MKKGCLIAFGVFVALVLAVLAVGVHVTNKKYGYIEAEPVSHEAVALPFTRFRFALNPEKLADYMEQMLGANAGALPGWLPMGPNELAQKVMPYEIALMCNSNYEQDQVDVRLFLNERRGGPLMPELARQEKLLDRFSAVQWDEAGLRFERRGVLTADGRIPFPNGLESRVRMDWDVDAGEEALLLEGGHLAEAVLDNRNGEAALLLGALIDKKQGLGWRQHFDTPNLKVLLELLKEVTVVRLNADLASIDAIRIVLRIDALPEAAPSFQNFSNLVYPMLADGVEQQYGLKLDGKGEWVAEESAFVGNYRLSGLSKFIDQSRAAGQEPVQNRER